MLYFDHNATTPVDPAVAEDFAAAVRELWGNPSSIHAGGQASRQGLEQARRAIASGLNAAAGEIVLTSGGAESNNLAVFGVARAAGKQRHVLSAPIEHSSVLGPCRQLEREGFAVSYVPVSRDGIVDPDDVRRHLRPETVLVTVAHANNEVGAMQNVAEIASLAHANGSLMHSDGVQAVGKVSVDLQALGVDLYSVSGHKLYAPKGTGLLYVRKNTRLSPLFFGGRQERERRAGTENVPGAIALAKAMALAKAFESADQDSHLRDSFESQLRARIPGFEINSAGVPRVPNTSSITFNGVSGEAVVIALDMQGIAVSTGSACSSGSVEPSHVLLAMGRSRDQARSTLRFSFGRANSPAEVDRLVDVLESVVSRLRATLGRELRYA